MEKILAAKLEVGNDVLVDDIGYLLDDSPEIFFRKQGGIRSKTLPKNLRDYQSGFFKLCRILYDPLLRRENYDFQFKIRDFDETDQET
ncbi:MAG: hypothetical protein AABW56_00120 [Nanoarchaeota archaeon]